MSLRRRPFPGQYQAQRRCWPESRLDDHRARRGRRMRAKRDCSPSSIVRAAEGMLVLDRSGSGCGLPFVVEGHASPDDVSGTIEEPDRGGLTRISGAEEQHGPVLDVVLECIAVVPDQTDPGRVCRCALYLPSGEEVAIVGIRVETHVGIWPAGDDAVLAL